jgi:hypothetical protein
VTKLGGLIGAVLLPALVLFVGDRIPWLSRQSDYIGTAVLVAAVIGGWYLGSRIVGRLRTRHAPPHGLQP